MVWNVHRSCGRQKCTESRSVAKAEVSQKQKASIAYVDYNRLMRYADVIFGSVVVLQIRVFCRRSRSDIKRRCNADGSRSFGYNSADNTVHSMAKIQRPTTFLWFRAVISANQLKWLRTPNYATDLLCRGSLSRDRRTTRS